MSAFVGELGGHKPMLEMSFRTKEWGKPWKTWVRL